MAFPYTYPSTVKAKFAGRYDEARALEALEPGHLLQMGSTGTVPSTKKLLGHPTNSIAVAFEDALQGKTMDDAYAQGDLVFFGYPAAGDELWIKAQHGVNYSKADRVASNGDGTIRKLGPNGGLVLFENSEPSDELTNTTDETPFSITHAFAANTLKVGDKIRIQGVVSVLSDNATNTLILKLKLGTVTLLTSATVDVAAGHLGRFDAEFEVVAIGATGSIVGSGSHALGAASVIPTTVAFSSNAVDTTGSLAVSITGQWSAASEDNQAVLSLLRVSKESTDLGVQALGEVVHAKDLSEATSPGFVLVRF